MDEFLRAAIEEAELGLAEGGIPIGSVLVDRGRIVGRGRNRRVQRGSVVLHGEKDALENSGRHSAQVYRECTLYTTLSPCAMCSGAILLYGIPRVVVGENRTFLGEEELLAASWPRGRGGRASGCAMPGADGALHSGRARLVGRGHRPVSTSLGRRSEPAGIERRG